MIGCKDSRSYKDSKVTWGAGDVSSWRQRPGDVLQAEGCGDNPQGQANHQVTLRAFKCPTVTRIHVRLEEEEEDVEFNKPTRR